MKKFYQSEWQGIEFAKFTDVTPSRLAGVGFYQEFYSVFFNRYEGWQELPSRWRHEKEAWSKLVLS